MTTNVFNPAIFQLLRLQSRGRRRRIWRRFCEPRRFVLSAIACVLAVLWLGNAAATVWLREQASPETLRALLSLGLVLYAGWHVTKAAFFRPANPFDWTAAERDTLAAMPLLPRDLVAYQIASVTVTTILKTGLFTLLLLPDLRCVPLGVIGLMLAMLTLELVRMAVDIAAWGMGRALYLTYRTAVIVGLIVGGFLVVRVIVNQNALGAINVGEGLLATLLGFVIQVNASFVGVVALPFRPLIDLILADAVTAANLRLAATALATVTALAAALVGFYGWTVRRATRRERRDCLPIERQNPTRIAASAGLQGPSLQRIPRWGGAGPIAWRQLVAAGRHWGALLTAMIAPAVLAAAPCFVIADPFFALLCTTGTLAFYTFLLLPTALRFDFRRDLDRLAILKGLPITPAAAVIGQMLAPVLIATLFQCAVLAFAVAARSLPLHQFAAMILVMIPLNVLVFSLDNLIFLLYPYRIQQEGLEIFLRTMLTFTGKGLLFTAGLVAMGAWGLAAAAITRGLTAWTGSPVNAYVVFTAGMIVGPALLAAMMMRGLCRTYRNMNPIEDVPR